MNNKITFTMENGVRFFHKDITPEEEPMLICHNLMSLFVDPSHQKVKVFISKVRPHRKGWKVCRIKYYTSVVAEIQVGLYNQFALLPRHISFVKEHSLDIQKFWVKVVVI